MPREFKLPDVGEGVAEGELVRWLVEPGDAVSEDQPVAEVETDKALVEVPSPVDGTVRELRAEEGEIVPVGNVIIVFDVEGEEPEEPLEAAAEPEPAEEGAAETPADAGEPAESAEDGAEAAADAEAPAEEPSTSSGRVFAAPSARRLARERGVDIARVDGSGPGGRVTEADVRAAAGDADATDAAAGGSAEPTRAVPVEEAETATATASPAASVEPAGRETTLATPASRRIAKEEGVDIDDVPATEQRDGEAYVTPEAVREYAEAQRAAQAADAAAVAGESETGLATREDDVLATREGASGGVGAEGVREERIPYRGVRRTIGEAMERSKFTAPHVTHHETFDAAALVEARADLKPVAEDRGIRLTYTPLVMKATVAALKEHPKLNASLDEEAGEIVRKGYYHVGVAVATDAGLMVPVVKDVDRKGVLQIASEVNELAQKARDRSIGRDELQGSTFTITNFGAIGGDYATPIINHPEVGILGLGELKQRPTVVDGEVVARHTLPISLSIDHRIVDGADAARFAETFGRYVENPTLLLLE